MRGAEREHDRVFGRGRLQLEVEASTEALAQRQAPGAVDAAAEGRVDDQVHAAGLVEEALEDDRFARRHGAQGQSCRDQILGDLLAPRARQIAVSSCSQAPTPARSRCRSSMPSRSALTERRELVGARRRLAEPERDARRLALGVRDPHHAGLDAQDAPRDVAELEDVARHALDGEVFVHGTDRRSFGLEHDLVVEVVRDRAAVGDRGEARASPRTNLPVDLDRDADTRRVGPGWSRSRPTARARLLERSSVRSR